MKPIKKTTKPIKYTEEFCLNEVREMYKYITETKEGKNVIFISELTEWRGYSLQRWTDNLQAYDNEEITETIKRIESILELRLAKGMIAGKLNATGVIFTLKNKYKWKDKHETEITGKDGGAIETKTTINQFKIDVIDENK
jgi:hypothetical protein